MFFSAIIFHFKNNLFLRLQLEQGKSFTICKFMLTKVRLHLYEELIPYYPEWPRDVVARANSGISAKIKQTVIGLPSPPHCGQSLNVLSFEAHFGFTDFEREYLADCNYEVEIREIVICDGYLEVYGRKVE